MTTRIPRQLAEKQAPVQVLREVEALAEALDVAIPAKLLDRNLLIGTWNLRAFGDLSDTWDGKAPGGPQRDYRALATITEIVSRFDVVAIQEVKGNLRALRHMMRLLGPDWGFILTDVNRGQAGNDERLAFVFDLRRVRPSGLACELVLSDEDLGVEGAGELAHQFARIPYAVSFVSAGQTFLLVTLHVKWGNVPDDRLPELRGVAKWAKGWADEIRSWGQNLIVLGDFNIDRKGDAAFEEFTSTGLESPAELDAVPRTIFAKAGGFYDQIAWFTEAGGTPLLTLSYTGRAGGFDFLPHAFAELEPEPVSWRISDHYPLWCEFGVPPSRSVARPPDAASATKTASAKKAAPAKKGATRKRPAPSPAPSPRGRRPLR